MIIAAIITTKLGVKYSVPIPADWNASCEDAYAFLKDGSFLKITGGYLLITPDNISTIVFTKGLI